jgi:Domain of unknown function (DUF4032)/Lipopolysaccharide kinase (Kdo/WaaP) family
VRFQLLTRTELPDFLDLPWERPLTEWESPRIVEVSRGVGRHVVRFVEYGGRVYALKELPERFAKLEFRLLRELEERSIPVVELVGLVEDRAGEGNGVLVTRFLDYSLPYRLLFTGRGVPDLRNRLLDALAQLLVRLHLAGFFWGDCSLSNALFLRDAGALAAYVVDVETGELHPQLSDGQRGHDLEIAELNVAGELLDLAAESPRRERAAADENALLTARELRPRYGALWAELTSEDVFAPDERFRLEGRLRRLNELGFDVEEIELIQTDQGYKMRLPTQVVEPGHHRRRLLSLTGLDVEENQARRLLNDMSGFRVDLERREGRSLAEAVVAYRWRTEVYDAALAAIPVRLRGKLPPAEIFHELLDHRWYRSEAAGRDIGLAEAVRSYVDQVLTKVPDEGLIVASADGTLRRGVGP